MEAVVKDPVADSQRPQDAPYRDALRARCAGNLLCSRDDSPRHLVGNEIHGSLPNPHYFFRCVGKYITAQPVCQGTKEEFSTVFSRRFTVNMMKSSREVSVEQEIS